MKNTGQPHRLDKNIIPCCHLLRQGKEIQMADPKSLDVRDVDIDLGQISIKEWRSLRDPAQPDEEEFALIASHIDDQCFVGVISTSGCER